MYKQPKELNLSISEIKNKRKKEIIELKQKENETRDEYLLRKQEFYTSMFKSKDEYILLKHLILKDEPENLNEFKDRILITKHEFEIYPGHHDNLFESLEYELKGLLTLNIDAQLETIFFGATKYKIDIEGEHIAFKLEKRKAEHYKKIEFIEKEIELNKKLKTNIKNDFNYLKYNWFDVGLKFAKNEISLDITQSPNYTQIAKQHYKDNWDGYRPYINSSIANSQNDKNIFLSKKKISQIMDYCKKNNIEVSKQFQDKLPNNYDLDN